VEVSAIDLRDVDAIERGVAAFDRIDIAQIDRALGRRWREIHSLYCDRRPTAVAFR